MGVKNWHYVKSRRSTSMKIVAFIPIKLNNERLPGKNVKRFSNGVPLLTFALNTALKIKLIDEVYCYCSSNEVAEHLPEGVKLLIRPKSLDLSSATGTDLVTSFAKQIEADVYIKIHCTAPFLSTNSIMKGLKAVIDNGYDSALTAEKHNAFLWSDGKPKNYDSKNIPRTQDLEPFYTETTGMYIYRKTVVEQGRRVGENPFLIEVDKIEATDIDYAIDFKIADAILAHVLNNQ